MHPASSCKFKGKKGISNRQKNIILFGIPEVSLDLMETKIEVDDAFKHLLKVTSCGLEISSVSEKGKVVQLTQMNILQRKLSTPRPDS